MLEQMEHMQQQQQQIQMEQSPVEQMQQQQQQLVTLGDMADLTQEIQEGIVSIPKEVILISLVSQEHSLYNPKHEHYRNTPRKDAKWLEIAESVGWTESQCKAKWKAMRDQYCRELKRSKFNVKANVKWKYFKELEFLRPFALSRHYRPRHSTALNNNNNNNATIANNIYITNNNTSSGGSNNNSLSDTNNKFPSIKIEAGQFSSCDFTATAPSTPEIKNENSSTTRLLTSEQLNNVMQQQQPQQQAEDGTWNYLATTTTTTNRANSMSGNDILQQQQQQQHHQVTTNADEVLYNAFVDCVAAAESAGQKIQNQLQQLEQQQQQHAEEDDDDLIHTFLNIESYFEKELIALIQQEDILYNSFHPNYRNVKLKLEVWDEIARKLKKTVKQCRLKWKALRDQYIREHKRLKNRENVESLPRWKHYDALNFLQKFIKHKSNEFDAKNIIQIPKNEIDVEMDEHIMSNSPLPNPLEITIVPQQQENQQQQLHTLPSLSGPHEQQQQHQHQQQPQQPQQNTHDENLCRNVSAYDEMDIDNYIIGNASDDPHDEDVDEDEEIDGDDDDQKSQQQFPDYVTTSTDNNNENGVVDDEQDDFKDVKSITQDSTQQLQQQQQQQQQLLHQSDHKEPLDITDATTLAADETLHQPQQKLLQQNNAQHHPYQQQQQDFKIEMPTSATLNGTTSTTTTLPNGTSITIAGITSAHNMSNLSPVDAIMMNGASGGASNGLSTPTASGDDDEVGAFFKAVAMKIRNAKMTPVAFTDLQIDILRVINGSLRNH